MSHKTTELLDLIRVRNAACSDETFTSPWNTQVPPSPRTARFHVVLSGKTWISSPKAAEPAHLHSGDIALIPHGSSYRYSSTRDLASPPPNGASLRMLSGQFKFSEDYPPSLFSRLPDLMVGPLSGGSDASPDCDKFTPTIQLIKAAMSGSTQVNGFALNRLTELLCQDLIQNWLSQASQDQVSLQAFTNPRLTEVIDTIHADPNAPWTVESLARIYGQSRSAFAAHFKLVTGQSPITYVRHCRINRACKMLEETALPVDEVAYQSGYVDANAFNRAFRRETGASPGAYRRQQRAS